MAGHAEIQVEQSMVLYEKASANFSTEVCKFKAMDQRLAPCTGSAGL